MKRHKTTIFVFLLFALMTAIGHSEEAKPDKTVYFLVHSGACNCQKHMCQQAAPIGFQIKSRLAEKIEYVSLDYGVQPEKTDPITHKYKIFTFPAVLVVNAEGHALFKKQGRLQRDEVLQEMEKLGVIKKEKSE